MTQLRIFKPEGILAFGDALDGIRSGQQVDLASLQNSPTLTELVADGPALEVQPFQNRRAAGEFFYKLLQPHTERLHGIDRNTGLWAWLSLAWLDILAPPDDSGWPKLLDQARYFPYLDHSRRYYRHLLVGPYRIYKLYRDQPDVAMAVLATPVNAPGEIVEQLTSRQDIIVNRNLMQAVTSLYYDPVVGTLKRGSGSKTGGSSRRLTQILEQFDLTWDVHGMPSQAILDLLPKEFAKFR